MSTEKQDDPFAGFGELSDPFDFADENSGSGKDVEVEEKNPFDFDESGIDGPETSPFGGPNVGIDADTPFDGEFVEPSDPVAEFRREAETSTEVEDPFLVANEPRPNRADDIVSMDDEDVAEVAASTPAKKPMLSRATMIALAGTAVIGVGFAAMTFLSSGGSNVAPVQIAERSGLDAGLEGLRPAGGAWADGAAAPSLPPINRDLPMTPNEPSPLPVASGAAAAPSLPDIQPVSPFDTPISGDAEPSIVQASLPTQEEDVSVSADMLAEFRAMSEEIKELKTRLASIEEHPVAPSPAVQPPAKPEVVENWSLKGVFGDTAWLSEMVDGKPADTREVTIGDDVEGVGRVKDITKYEGNWIVVTDAGVILRD